MPQTMQTCSGDVNEACNHKNCFLGNSLMQDFLGSEQHVGVAWTEKNGMDITTTVLSLTSIILTSTTKRTPFPRNGNHLWILRISQVAWKPSESSHTLQLQLSLKFSGNIISGEYCEKSLFSYVQVLCTSKGDSRRIDALIAIYCMIKHAIGFQLIIFTKSN